MATISCFEDIEAWRKARELVKKIYAVSGRGLFARDMALRDQIRRAAISVASNIAEGFERGGRAEFIHLLSVAKGSAGEVRSQLYIALDLGYLSEVECAELKALVVETSNMISGLMKYLRSSVVRGVKFKEG